MGSTSSREKVKGKIPKVVVLCGGTSPEREVSISSGKNVLNALRNLEINSELMVWNGDFKELESVKSMCFIMLHGSPGEDGSVQRFFEERDIPYTGSDSKSCEITIDKIRTKEYFQKLKIKTPNWSYGPISFPCVFKPRFGGSSIGVRIIFSESEIGRSEDGFYEDYIDGREITVSILDIDGNPTVLPILEIIPKGTFYDYESKYSPDGSKLITPAPLNFWERNEIEKAALKVYKEVNCKGFARIDGIILDGEFYFLEVNAIPGMTPTSDLPASARAFGLEMEDVVVELLDSALRR
ncbi:D-alanine--D-alanine ligase family protein [Athalassotoga saccharophila]|uniref:D-alanine--D-alanine ligase family protein n=1 Tax=Athalassotoga saccharophila TaxID=1441386 RepID=UPI001379C794|nr:D-alanine--D-alanine ligase [Athalassotoga saccharophila]BBJ27646.1 D-alanine--D-alanine ligase B [Athalassotoga saccharophila]